MHLGENQAEQVTPDRFAQDLLRWYDKARRDLPWRAAPGVRPDPYHVWLSEIMLQQTTVKAVIPYFAKFLAFWPSVQALADAPLDDLLSAWAGLGYYARARNLHACAKEIAESFGGDFPTEEKDLLMLPGIGAYTAAAIAAIAFDHRAVVIDGNVERVLSRCFAVETPLPHSKKELREIAETLTPDKRPGDFAQAMMDLGATVCTPRSPSCVICPLVMACAGRASGLETSLPYKVAKAAKPTRRGAAFFVQREDGAILLRRRPEKGLLGGMTEVPGTPWVTKNDSQSSDPFVHAPVKGQWKALPGEVRHTFTHFHLELKVYGARVENGITLTDAARTQDCLWVRPEDIDAQALPSVMRKVVELARSYMREEAGLTT